MIAVDVGNSSISTGYFSGGGLVVQKIDTDLHMGADKYAAAVAYFMDSSSLEKERISCIISSVVPSLTGAVEEGLAQIAGEEIPDIMRVDYRLHTGLKFDEVRPGELGTDRIASAVAASNIYSPPVAVVDFGTATTITVVDDDYYLIGGSIMPGVGLMNDMLEEGTARLKRALPEAPPRALGVSTDACIRTGLFFGTAGGVERILAEIESEKGFALNVVITGGYAPAIERLIKRPHFSNPHLTLQGLKMLHETNRRKA